MSFYNLKVQDSLVLRDNRFGQGSIMRSLEWVSPSVMAGSARTAIGKARTAKGSAIQWNHDELRKISVAGPYPVKDGVIGFFPPADVVVQNNRESGKFHVYPVTPREIDGDCGTDLPEGLLPCFLPDNAINGKPVSLRGFWSLNRMVDWLLGNFGSTVDCVDDMVDWNLPVVDQSTHVKIDAQSQSAEDGMLFTCSQLSFANVPYEMSVKIGTEDLSRCEMHPIGGERRLVRWNRVESPAGWSCPDKIRAALADCRHIRMVLASPAIFKNGWLPDWMDVDTKQGVVPGTNVKVVLKSAVIPRWKAISGWSYEFKGPKPIRRMVPTGSVYFFDVIDGDTAEIAQRWMESVCLENQDINDGFGLALWGNWKF